MNFKFLIKKYFKPLTVWLFFLGFLMVNSLFAQQGSTLKGTIVDSETQMPIPGANVLEKGTTNGVSTDFDGNFILTLRTEKAVLEISYVGYKKQEIQVSNRTNIEVVLQPDAQALNEIVLVGYGSQKKTDLTGSVGTIDSKALTERNFTNPLESIQGNVAGVQISSTTGRLGDGFDIVIRGKNTVSGDASPLFIVDGVPADDINFLNPQDIDRIDILKDASSTAIYGSRGSNGVVLVTTKSGASAKAGFHVSFDSFYGVKEVARLPKLMDPQKWWYYHQSAYLATASANPATGQIDATAIENAVFGNENEELRRRVNNNETFDWYDAVLRTAMQQNTYIDISGKSDKGLGYNIGMGYQKETGNILNESQNKYNFKVGVNDKVSDKFSTGANLTVSLTEESLGSDIAMQEAFRLNPFLNPYGFDGELTALPGTLLDEDGNLVINKTSTYNPLLQINNANDDIRRWKLIGNVYAQYNVLEWLSFKSSFSGNYDNLRRGRSWGVLTNEAASNNDLPLGDINNRERFSYTWDNQFNIDKTIGDNHSFNLLGLYSLYSSRRESSFLSSRNMPFETGFYNLGSGEQGTFGLGSNFIKQTLVSYALRLNYSFMDRYLFTLSNRWDGSSLLSDANRWDSFPSAAFAWRLSEEAFLNESPVISNLKIRLSYGYTGNNKIAPYSTLNLLDSQTFYDYNGTLANGWLPSSLANSEIGWEKTREFNAGLDFGFYNNRISGSIDVYDRLSKDLLLQQQLPIETGWGSIAANVGSVKNRGVEIALTTRNVQTDHISWTTSFTFTKNTNSIESIYGQDLVDDPGNNFFIGESIDALYNYKFIGIWQPGEEEEAAGYGMRVGQEKLLDVNGDGRYGPDDRVILGSSDPDWSGSFFTSLKVYDFDISASIITNQGVLVYSPFHENFTNTRDRGRQKLDIEWFVPQNDAGIPAQYSNSYPQPRNEGSYWRNDGVGYYRDASFVKVKNITLGYNFKNELLEKLKLTQMRLYVNVLNPFVITNYDGYDPEWGGASLQVGRTSSVIYQLGFNLKF